MTKKDAAQSRPRLYTLGIDPGLSGAAVLLADGRFVGAVAMRPEKKKSGKNRLNVSMLLEDIVPMLRYLSENSPKSDDGARYARLDVAIEEVGAMPGQGSVSGFTFGETFGAARMLGAYMARATRGSFSAVRPSIWKKSMGLESPSEHKSLKAHARRTLAKKYALTRARECFAGIDIDLRAQDRLGLIPLSLTDGIAEAALLALYHYLSLTSSR